MKEPKIGFIGVGNIASAIIGGVTHSGYIKHDNVFVYDTNSDKTQSIAYTGVNVCENAVSLVRMCDYIFLTIKPQIYEIVLKEIARSVSSGKCLVDVGAGISIEYVKSVIGKDCKVIRAMPNTPLLYGEGATALVKQAPVSDKEFDFIKGAFDSCGKTFIVNECDMDAVTAVSGSSPAFVFRFAANLIKSAVDAGMDPSVAKELVATAIKGSAIMAAQSPLGLNELIKMVASPNGTTEAGLNSMNESGFDNSVYLAAEAARKRSIELKK